MIERAEWRRETVRSTPARLVFGVDRWRGIPLTAIVLGFFVAYNVVEALYTMAFGKEWRAIVTSPLSWLLMLAFGSLVRRPRPRLAPDPAPGPLFPVRMLLRAKGRAIGEDRGIVTFADGWLVFEGERTSFSIKATDATMAFSDSSVRFGLPDAQVLELRALGNQNEMKSALKRWAAHPSATGLSRLPPLDVHPSASAKVAFGLQVLGSLVLGTIVGIAIGGILGGRGISPHLAPNLIVCALIAASLSCLAQALVSPSRKEEASVKGTEG